MRLPSHGAATLATAALVLAVVGVASPAAARPGAPNSESSWSPAPGAMTIRWRNTADEGGIVFDIEGQTDAGIANWALPGGVGLGAFATFTFANLAPGPHCFRIWSRVGPQGLRSGEPSAFTCTVVTGHARPYVHH